MQNHLPVDDRSLDAYDRLGPLRLQMPGYVEAKQEGVGRGDPPAAESRTQIRAGKKTRKARKGPGAQGGKEKGGRFNAPTMDDVIINPDLKSKCRLNKNLGKQTARAGSTTQTSNNQEPSNICQPAFLVIGAQKSGTSTLAHLMGQHPQIKKPTTKEILFFNWNNDFKIKCEPSRAGRDGLGIELLLEQRQGCRVVRFSARGTACWVIRSSRLYCYTCRLQFTFLVMHAYSCTLPLLHTHTQSCKVILKNFLRYLRKTTKGLAM